MRDAVAMWRNTRLVVLTAVSASLYAALLIPFKVLPLIHGVTELRPANAVPVVCSFLFGPAGAWGAAIGNLIGDFFGGIGPGDLFGFAGNFLYGFLPYTAWRALSGADPLPRTAPQWVAFVGVVALAAVVIGVVGGLVVGNLLSTGRIEIAALVTQPPGTRAAQVGVGVAPFVALVGLGVILL